MAKTFSAVAVFFFPMYTENSKMESFLQKCYWRRKKYLRKDYRKQKALSAEGLQKTENIFSQNGEKKGVFMKTWYKRLLCFGLMGVLLFTLVSAAEPAQAAASSARPTCPVNVGYVVAEHDWETFEILHLDGVREDDRIIGLKSSDPSLVEAETIPMDEGPAIHLGLKSGVQGTAKVRFTLKRKNGRRYRYITKVRVYAYENPLEQFSIGNTDFAEQFQKNDDVEITKKYSGKLQVALKEGYQVKSICKENFFSSGKKTLKNGSKVTVNQDEYIRISYQNTKKNYTYTVYLSYR